MPASETNTRKQPESQSQSRPSVPAAVSMRELLASCAAAEAVSRPPRAPEPAPEDEQRPAA
jgi:hypothetical protein